jgi:DNA polymerase-3 subunit gamma/tau
VFENVIDQGVIEQLKHDFVNAALPPSILFCGPIASAKGTTALELARVLSCEASAIPNLELSAAWSCRCDSCARHRTLSHPDLLVLGSRNFLGEICACRNVFLNDMQTAGTRTLFVRAVRKLLLRFSPIIWEGDPKISKWNPLVETIRDSLDELEAFFKDAKAPETTNKLEKLCDVIVNACVALEAADGLTANIPIAQIRHSSYWLRMSPNGRRKTLIIENAEKMNDSARNSLLKILEEPPSTATIVLTSARPKALLATITSRVRQYKFMRRSVESEIEVLKRIFKQNITDTCGENPILRFQSTFLPVSSEKLAQAAAFFWSSIAARTIVQKRKKSGASLPVNKMIVTLGSFCAPIAVEGGFPKHESSVKALVTPLCKNAADFKPRSLFNLFMGSLYEMLSRPLREAPVTDAIRLRSMFKRHAETASSSVETYNQSPQLALERLAVCLCNDICREFD